MMSKQTNTNPGNTKQSLWAQIRTLILVTFLAGLVWLLAESRMIQTRMVELQIVLVGNIQDTEHQFVVRPSTSEDWVESINVELEGSLASLDQASRQLKGRIQLVVGDHIPARPGDHDLDLHSILRNLPPLRSNGVSVRAISKDIVRVEVDELIAIELSVRPDVPTSVALDGSARAIPQTVTVNGPSSFLANLEGREMVAIISSSALTPLIPGQLETIPSIALNFPASIQSALNPSEPVPPGWIPTITPSRVDVRLTIRSLTQITTIDRLPVQILLAPGEVGRWNIVLNPGSEDLVSIQISGPTEALSAINDGSISPAAVLALSFQELERSISSKQIEIVGLPKGVKIISELPEIGFEITRTVQIPQNPVTTTP